MIVHEHLLKKSYMTSFLMIMVFFLHKRERKNIFGEKNEEYLALSMNKVRLIRFTRGKKKMICSFTG